MFTVGDMKRAIRGYEDDIPIMLWDHNGGFEPMEAVGSKRVFFQGYHCESGGWEDVKKASPKQLENGHIFTVTIQ